jgi:2-keto-4-pentenoate hydratase
MNDPANGAESLARLLNDAFAPAAALSQVPSGLVPRNADDAYRVQERLLQLRGQRAGGWKVGAKSESGPIQGAPLPANGIQASPARLDRAAFPVLGLELEIAFRLGRTFAPSARGYSSDEVLGSLASYCAAIEIVSSRLAAWPEVDRLLQLADLQNHGALAVGGFVDYDRHFPFLSPSLDLRFDGDRIAQGRSVNPAGDPRRLLAWVVNHCTMRGQRFEEGTIVTTGSYTGIYFAKRSGTAEGDIAGLPAVSVRLD